MDLPSFEAYLDFLQHAPADSSEWSNFSDVVTTNKTDFFREKSHFGYLQRALHTLDPDPFRPWQSHVWCAGCSSGEEAYTLAMVLNEFGLERPGFDFSVLATDICGSVLEQARTAIYDAARVEPVDLALRRKYLLRSRNPDADLVRIVPSLRSRVDFRQLNFMAPDYGHREAFDAIFYRNVSIYFDRDTQAAVARKLCLSLRTGGYLFIGHSESLHGFNLPLRMVSAAVYCKE